VKKVTAFILFVVLTFAASVPVVARARTNSQRAAQQNAKRSLKLQKKQHKKDLKAQQKATKQWRKHHSTTW